MEFYDRSRFEEESRNNKKVPPQPRNDPRSNADFASKQFSNLPPRLLRQQQHNQNSQPYASSNQRTTPSPGATSGQG